MSPSLLIQPPVNDWSAPQEWDSVVFAERQRQAVRELARRELSRRDFLSFTSMFTPDYSVGWIHTEVAAYLDAFLEACERNERPRLMVFLPPRHGKSQLVSRCFAPYILGRHPKWEVVLATYNQEMASILGRDVRGILNDSLYADLFPSVAIAKDSNAMDHVRTTDKGSFSAVGVGSSLTGRGAKILLIDDPVKDRETADSEVERRKTWDWYSSTARTRLAPGGGIIILQTRWHQDDLAGMLLAKAKESKFADQWHVYSYPAVATQDEPNRAKGEALDSKRWPMEELASLRGSMSPRDWTALYQQNPVPDDGNFFKKDWIKTFKRKDLPKSVYWYVSTDFAIGQNQTNDWTVLTPFAIDHDHNIYICKPVRKRIDAYEIVEELLDLIEEHSPMYVAIERGHISKSIGPHLKARSAERRMYGYTIWSHTPHRDKTSRARSFQGRMQQGKIFFEACDDFEEYLLGEILAFPAGRWDDFVDTCSLGCLMLEDLVAPAPGPGLPDVDDEIVAGSMEDLERRMPDARNDNPHRPVSLFAHLKKRKKA